jgi:hypothetical protein
MQETHEEYRRRVLSHLEGRDPLKMQAAAPQRLERLLKGVRAAKARKRPGPGKWSINEIVAHLADTEVAVGFRLRMILGEPGVPIQAFDQDEWVKALHYEKRGLRQSCAQYRTFRDANVALLKTLAPAQWKHHGLHAERGEETIEMIVRMIAGHDINHMKQIENILAA